MAGFSETQTDLCYFSSLKVIRTYKLIETQILCVDSAMQ